MSRTDKREHQRKLLSGTDDTEGVRLFAYSTHRNPGYPVVHAPPTPLVVLRVFAPVTPAGEVEQHPTSSWKALADAVAELWPEHHASYLIDASAAVLDPLKAEERTVLDGHGPLLKRSIRVLKKLNPAKCSLVAAGTTAPLAMKLVMFPFVGAVEVIGRVVLFVPSDANGVIKAMADKVARSVAVSSNPSCLPELVVVSSDAAHKAQFVDGVSAQLIGRVFSSLSFVQLRPSDKAGSFRQLAAAAIPSHLHQSGPRSLPNRGDQRVFQIHFVLSKYSKQIEQRVELANTGGGVAAGASDDSATDEDDDAPEAAAHVDPIAGTPAKPGAPRFHFVADYSAQSAGHPVVAAGWLADGFLSNAHGSVPVAPAHDGAAASLASSLRQWVTVEATVQRDADGRSSLSVKRVVEAVKKGVKRSATGPNSVYCKASEVPSLQPLALRTYVGCALIRGRKVALVRSLDRKFQGMRFPVALHTDSNKSRVEAAADAVCHWLDVTVDNFSILDSIAPVVFYPDRGTQVTLFVAVASYAPPGGVARDAIEEDPADDDDYDWMSASQARKGIRREAELEALDDVVRNIQRAHRAGSFAPLHGLGVFGEVCSATRRPVVFVCGFDNHVTEAASKIAASWPSAILALGSTGAMERAAHHLDATAGSAAPIVIPVLPDDMPAEVLVDEMTNLAVERWCAPRIAVVVQSGTAVVEALRQLAEARSHTSSAHAALAALTTAEAVLLPDATSLPPSVLALLWATAGEGSICYDAPSVVRGLSLDGPKATEDVDAAPVEDRDAAWRSVPRAPVCVQLVADRPLNDEDLHRLKSKLTACRTTGCLLFARGVVATDRGSQAVRLEDDGTPAFAAQPAGGDDDDEDADESTHLMVVISTTVPAPSKYRGVVDTTDTNSFVNAINDASAE